MCAEDRCHAYGHNWTCPPACGTLEECGQRMHAYKHSILLQTVGQLRKDIDSRAYRETEKLHMQHFRELTELMKAYSSMEGYGLFVTQVCRDNDLPYYHGERTITYTACVLY